ncbi:MAG: hypothetical protein OEV94_10020 [Deltaproteobacteria bacterium]|nr:hypothetical protein [Deltaproteobacteria bacterium]MDH4122027.1 hypothetical protein [Deltaproteobacteria bacterium]
MATRNDPNANAFFRSVQAGEEGFDSEKFLLEVKNAFQSEEISHEVHWRIQVLKEIYENPEYQDVGDGLKGRLSKIFATSTDENEILRQLKDLTEVEGAKGNKIDLRTFTKREKRVLGEMDYRKVLNRKLVNTKTQVDNLLLFFPDKQAELNKFTQEISGLANQAKAPGTPVQDLKKIEDSLRSGQLFKVYENLKEQFLRQWLEKFGGMNKSQVEGMDPKQIQRMIMEHQRHQMTQLLKTQIKPNDTDMSDHLAPHDTMECNYKEKKFWGAANSHVKEEFKKWIMSVIQAFGIIKGHRYAFFQNEKEPDQMLLFGIGVSGFSKKEENMVDMVPFIKPFTRKANFLLEIRHREIGNDDQYFSQLRHYVLPFVFGFDSMEGFKMHQDLIQFFTSKY